METTVNGKNVVLRERLPAKECYDLLAIVRKAATTGDIGYDEQVKVFTVIVESWEFEGDPKDPEADADLDLLTEFVALDNVVGEYLRERWLGSKN